MSIQEAKICVIEGRTTGNEEYVGFRFREGILQHYLCSTACRFLGIKKPNAKVRLTISTERMGKGWKEYRIRRAPPRSSSAKSLLRWHYYAHRGRSAQTVHGRLKGTVPRLIEDQWNQPGNPRLFLKVEYL